MIEGSRLPNDTCASRRSFDDRANPASVTASWVNGREMMQSPTAASVNPSVTVIQRSRSDMRGV